MEKIVNSQVRTPKIVLYQGCISASCMDAHIQEQAKAVLFFCRAKHSCTNGMLF
jgi:hypothetical protein